MGLSLMVGYLAEALQEDPEFSSESIDIFSTLADCIEKVGVGKFVEPTELPEESWFSCQMWGYSGLHHLRRLSAYVALEEPMYEPSRDLPNEEEPVVERYYAAVRNGDISNLPFQHLMLHGDSEGYYVPIDFKRVIDPGEQFEAVGGGIGSSIRLLAECRTLAAALKLPESVDHEGTDVWDAADSPGRGAFKWQRYGIESFSCIRLIRACERSIETGAAVVFC